METSDLIAGIALAVSISTFFWNEWKDARKKKKKLLINLNKDLIINEEVFAEDIAIDMQNAGIPSNEIPDLWRFEYTGEITLKNKGHAIIQLSSISIATSFPSLKIDLPISNSSKSIKLEKGDSFMINFNISPEDVDFDKFFRAQYRVEVIDLDDETFKSDWVKLNFPESIENY